jgi:hypothetical protein
MEKIGIKKFKDQMKPKDFMLVLGKGTHCRSILNTFKDISSFTVSTVSTSTTGFDYIFICTNDNDDIVKSYYKSFGYNICDSLELFKDILKKCITEDTCVVFKLSKGKDKVFWYDLK